MNESTAIHRRVAACRIGADPTLITRLDSGWVVLGDPQVLRGYSLLLPDPVVPHLNALAPAARQFAGQADDASDLVFVIDHGVDRLAAAWQLENPVVQQLDGDIYLSARVVLPR